jgi:hypothetical protein
MANTKLPIGRAEIDVLALVFTYRSGVLETGATNLVRHLVEAGAHDAHPAVTDSRMAPTGGVDT